MPTDAIVASREFPGPFVRIRGHLSREGEVEWDPCVRTFREQRNRPSPRDASHAAARIPTTRYRVVLSNAQGREVARAPVVPEFYAHYQEWASFGVRLPYGAGVTSLALRRGRQTLGVLTVPNELPKLRLLAPLTLPHVDPEAVLRLRWEPASTKTALTYFVRYSHDGHHWIRPTPSRIEPQYSLDLSEMPGGPRCVVQILATNGYQTSYVQTPSFTLPRKPPTILLADITGPLLFAQGFSREDGPITGEAISWISDEVNTVGSGGTFDVRRLQAGDHGLAVRVVDQSDATAVQNLGLYSGHTGYRIMSRPGL
jgi:hypothetical protein